MNQLYPTAEFVRECFRYEDGRLFYQERPPHHFKTHRAYLSWNARWVGKEAGAIQTDKRGNRRCRLNFAGRMLRRYQIVWAIHMDAWADQIDHKNRNSLDDRFENLRLATTSQNAGNTGVRLASVSGYKGVEYRASKGTWSARIMVGGVRMYLGSFDNPEAARTAYEAASREHRGEFHCPTS